MHVDPAQLTQYAASHDEVASQIAAAATGIDSEAAVAAVYGAAGAPLSAAVAAFEAAVRAAGSELATGYRDMAAALRNSADQTVSTDASNAAQFGAAPAN
jgi:hypothetical protein